MKITQSRLKEIIREELARLGDDVEDSPHRVAFEERIKARLLEKIMANTDLKTLWETYGENFMNKDGDEQSQKIKTYFLPPTYFRRFFL